ncbi:MAG: hypothetical protein GEV05_09865 [Betaproteobacteria bacterium]|nr:hypothetical protein [Betaproteobacteria bacterium]
MERSDTIRTLVDAMLDACAKQSDLALLRVMLVDGFPGHARLTDDELMREQSRFEALEFDEPDGDLDYDDDPDAEDEDWDESIHFVMRSRMVPVERLPNA